MRQRVEVLIIRTNPCAEDSRVNKFLYHYNLNDVEMGTVCVSRTEICKGPKLSKTAHECFIGLNFNALPKSLGLIARFRFGFKFLLLVDRLRFCFFIRKKFVPNKLHGCDLDGYLIARFAFPFMKSKTIFEVYDPWSTMTNSKKIQKLENRAFRESKVLIMPAEDSRIKPIRPKSTFFSNFLDPGLAEKLIENSDKDSAFQDKIDSVQPYILSGGILGVDTGLKDMISVFAQQDKFNLVIAANESFLTGNGFLSIPSKVHAIGKVSWTNWIYALSRSSAVWIYYSKSNNHFVEKISPNKYWESIYFKKPMIVNDIKQFTDRFSIESQLYDLNENIIDNLPKVLLNLDIFAGGDFGKNQDDLWEKTERLRTKTVKSVLSWLD